MKRSIFVAAACLVVNVMVSPAWAEGTDSSGPSSVTSAEGLLGNTNADIRPQIGFINYNDVNQNGLAELAIGATVSYNALKSFNPFNIDTAHFQAGPETGLFFAHLSQPGANFLLAPVNLKVAYLITDRIRLGAHGGGNLTYRSTADAMRLNDVPEGSTASFKILPNVGADLDYAISSSVALSIRPDITFSSGNNLVTATAAVVIPLA